MFNGTVTFNSVHSILSSKQTDETMKRQNIIAKAFPTHLEVATSIFWSSWQSWCQYYKTVFFVTDALAK
jgi:hypothetical protein